jgi:hypothetical protein
VWKRARGVGLYVACIQDDTVYVVGRTKIVAYAMKDGTETWDAPIEIPEPSGRGVRVGSKYLLPLSTGEIATIDLLDARIQGRSKLSDNQIPGNLAIGSDTLVSCGIFAIVGFPSLNAIEQQIRDAIPNVDNAGALALRGELRLHQGDETEAIRDLRESLTKKPDPQVKRILAGTLLNILTENPNLLLNVAEEMDQLTDDPRQKIAFLRLYADSLKATGKPVDAIKQLFRLAEFSSPADEMIPISTGYFLSVEQSIRSQLLTIYETADVDERTLIQQELQRQLDLAAASEEKEFKIARFVKLVSSHPAAASLLLNLVDAKEVQIAEPQRIRILDRLATRSIAASSIREALPWIEELDKKYRSQVCLEGETGHQLSEKWQARYDVREAMASRTSWSGEPIEVERTQGRLLQTSFAVEVVTHQGSHFVGWSFEIDPSAGVLSARDESSRIVWQMPYANFQEVVRAFPCQLHIRGHRLAFSFSTWLAVMECSDSYAPPKLLFEKQFRSNSPLDWRQNEFRMDRRLLPTGRRVPFDGRNPSGYLIGLSDDAVLYQSENRLFAFDVETGQVAWTRIGPQFAKSDATVDQLLAMHTEVNDAMLLRPLDGKILQQHKGIRSEKPIWFHGTRRLSHRLEGNDQQTLELHDFDGDKTVWKNPFPAGSLNWIVDNEVVAIFEPSGKLNIVSLETGLISMTAQLPVVRPYGSGGVLAVQRYGERYLVVAGIASRRTESLSVLTMNSDTSFTIDGHVSAVDRQTGDVAWSIPVEQQAFDFMQAANMPVLVLAAQHSKTNRSGQREMTRLSALILDKQTGRTVYSTLESLLQNCPGARFIPMIEDRKLVVDFQSWNLAITFSKPEK